MTPALCAVVFSLLCSSTPLAAPADSSDTDWRFIAAPFVLASSDNGVEFVLGVGFSRAPNLYLLAGGRLSTKGMLGVRLEGEVQPGRWRYAGKTAFTRRPRELYSRLEVDPEVLARAKVERTDIKLSALRRMGGHLELGPALWYERTLGFEGEDAAGDPLEISELDAFMPGQIVLAGVRARWRTTSAVRPTDGFIVDLIAQAGRAEWEPWDGGRNDAALQAMVGWARPLNSRARFYARLDGRYQAEAPPPLRNYVGGDKKVRGQPFRRESGRRVLLGRTQLHFTLLRSWTLPSRIARTVMPWIPLWELELEAVPFYDIGAAGDPEFGWLPTRHGLGAGLHLVLPPQLVLRLDVGVSPGGSPMFYLGLGEYL